MAGKRYSRQRELIYERLRESDEHPTAEMIYHWLKPENPALSLGTVYRNLNLLAEEGEIVRMPFPVERYDFHTEPHHHFQCARCGDVYDIELSYDNALNHEATMKSGHQVEGHSLCFKGTCRRCLARFRKSS